VAVVFLKSSNLTIVFDGPPSRSASECTQGKKGRKNKTGRLPRNTGPDIQGGAHGKGRCAKHPKPALLFGKLAAAFVFVVVMGIFVAPHVAAAPYHRRGSSGQRDGSSVADKRGHSGNGTTALEVVTGSS